MNQLGKRLLVSAGFISLAALTIFYVPHWFFFIVTEVFILLGLNEFFSLAEQKGLIIHRGFGLFFGAVLPFTAYYSLQPTLLLMACVALFVFLFNRRSPEKTITSVAVSMFGIVYVAWFFAYLLKIKLLPQGSAWVCYTISIVKAGDAAAYFVGKKFGKTKLLEHVSPKKSIEGAIAQMVATIGLSLVSTFYLKGVPLFHLFVLGTLVGALALLGDLAESLIKRDAGVKDSGNIPGLGGMLDVMDSLLFTIPFVYFYLTVFLGLEKL
ncbi:MAG TPA: phosphatidate cytidylyltransferase [Candidatus Omnitrophota bacterium]|nr:phosphatidate cytidylyltransferase [Candidatus Omnitrophota bacterium]HPS37704.1 phosphatidate cytidylyltransferase [Candidatus Omnitrophota bacterium]